MNITYPANDFTIDALLLSSGWHHKWSDNGATFTYSFKPSNKRISYNEKIAIIDYMLCLFNDENYSIAATEKKCPLINKFIENIPLKLLQQCSPYLESYYDKISENFLKEGEREFIHNLSDHLDQHKFKYHLTDQLGNPFLDLLAADLIYQKVDMYRYAINTHIEQFFNNSLKQYSNIAKLKFLPIGNRDADITLKISTQLINHQYSGLGISHIIDSDIIYSTLMITEPYRQSIDLYNYIMTHELGHVLGLKHPFTPPVILPNLEENTGTSVMSYKSLIKYDGDYGPELKNDNNPIIYLQGIHDFNIYYVDPITLGVYDIKAIQYLYGKNIDFRSGDTYYKFTNNAITNINEDSIDINININKAQSLTIYDTGGFNALDINDCPYTTIIELVPLSDSIMSQVSIICNNYVWFMADMHKIITGNAPVSLNLARDITHELHLHTKQGQILIGKGESAQKFFFHEQGKGSIYINGVENIDEFYFNSQLFDNSEQLLASCSFHEHKIHTTNTLHYNYRFLDQRVLDAENQLSYLSTTFNIINSADGMVKICFNDNCDYQVNLVYDVFDLNSSFTTDNIYWY